MLYWAAEFFKTMKDRYKFQKAFLTFFLFAQVAYAQNGLNENIKFSSQLKAVSNTIKSPYTGYTRQHWLEITEKIIAGEMAHFNKQSGLPEFTVPPKDSAYEKLRWNNPEEWSKRALERMMMAVVIYTKTTGKDQVPGYNGSVTLPFLNAIIAGTDPAGKGYWGDPLSNDQVGSVFAMAIYIEPQRWWEPLTASQKKNLLTYLKKQAHVKTYDNNHYFFHMLPAALLDKNGVASNRDHLTNMYERLMGWYRGNGWFLDGNNRTFDYYNLWGFQLFNQVLYRYDTLWRQQFGERIKNTTAEFLQTYPYLYGRDGGPIPWGRSLAYRFVGNSAIAWAVLNGNSTLPPGQARRIASGALKYFWEHGCIDSTGLLTLGYWGANASVAETYLYYGDPYWAMQGLAPLLIPETDPFWTSVEGPIPADGKGDKMAVTGAQFSIRVSTIDGDARLFPAGQPLGKDPSIWQAGSKYNQHAYASDIGFCLAGDDVPGIGAGRTGYSYDGIKWFYRERAKPIQITANHLASRYTLHPSDNDSLPDYNRDEMITHTLIGNDGEVHIFWHNNPEPLYLHLGGYGISVSDRSSVKEKYEPASILINGEPYFSLIEAIQAPEGKFESTVLEPRDGWSATHLFGGRGAFPYWHSTKGVPPNVPVIFYVNGTRNRQPVVQPIKIKKQGNELQILFEGEWYSVQVPF